MVDTACRKVLELLPTTYRVLHEVDLPGIEAAIDHLVIGPTGIFAIDTRTHAGSVKVKQGTLWHAGHPMKREIEGIRWETRHLAARLDRPIRPVLCFVDTSMSNPVIDLVDMTAVHVDALAGWVLGQSKRLSSGEIELCTQRARVLVHNPQVMGAGAGFVASPQLHQFRPPPLPVKRQPGFFLTVARWLVRLIPVALAVAGVVALAVLLGHRFGGAIENSLLPPSPSSRAATSATTIATGESDRGRPTVIFGCPTVGKGWAATAIPTVSTEDPRGFHLWYRLGTRSWTYWGWFQNGVAAPAPVTGLRTRTSFVVGMDPVKLTNTSKIRDALTFRTPSSTC
jgi:hypothetical protein